MIAVVFAVAFASNFSDRLPIDNMGISASQTCGWWNLKDDTGVPAYDADDLFQAEKERRAGDYQRDCYQQDPSLSPDRCSFFAQKSIPYHRTKNTDSELGDRDICYGGRYNAVQLE